MAIIIAIKNQTSVLPDAVVREAVTAIQVQLNRDWQVAWKTTATVIFLRKNQAVPATAWPIFLMDSTDNPGTLGYHTETNRGTPFGRVFVKTAIQYGYSWTITLSHEVLELMGNPWANETVFRQNSDTTGMLYYMEVCDPCEDDRYGYKIGNVMVSDFVYPAWFDDYQLRSGTRYDHCGHITAPFQILQNGYMAVFNVPNISGWNIVTRDNEVVQFEGDGNQRVRPGRMEPEPPPPPPPPVVLEDVVIPVNELGELPPPVVPEPPPIAAELQGMF